MWMMGVDGNGYMVECKGGVRCEMEAMINKGRVSLSVLAIPLPASVDWN